MTELGALLARVGELIAAQRTEFETGPVNASASLAELRAAFGHPTPEHGIDADAVIEQMAAAAAPGLIGIPGPRYFGFVVGGSHEVALGADWLTSGWDNNAGFYVMAPAAAVMEETAGRWVADLLRLPPAASVGFVSGATMANCTGLAAARHRVFANVGYDVESNGLRDAPPVRVLVGEERHATVDVALRYLGFGAATAEVVASDDQGRMRAAAIRESLSAGAPVPAIVCAQAGNVNTGAFDPIEEICEITHAHGGWVHVDGAFGIWAAVADDLRHLVDGAAAADSWATDAHKWLNVPYDCGIVACRDVDAHRASMTTRASYLIRVARARPTIHPTGCRNSLAAHAGCRYTR